MERTATSFCRQQLRGQNLFALTSPLSSFHASSSISRAGPCDAGAHRPPRPTRARGAAGAVLPVW